jgi:hypothetical protein
MRPAISCAARGLPAQRPVPVNATDRCEPWALSAMKTAADFAGVADMSVSPAGTDNWAPGVVEAMLMNPGTDMLHAMMLLEFRTQLSQFVVMVPERSVRL